MLSNTAQDQELHIVIGTSSARVPGALKTGVHMKERQECILGEIVSIYLETGQPVGSRVLAEQGRLGLSPASIRNVMAELEQRGYLHSPHTSAGRVPTDSGLRYFVDSLMVVDANMRDTIEQSLAQHLRDEASKRALLRRASDELASLTHFAGLVWVRESNFSRILRLELIPVSSTQVLAVIVAEGNQVQNRLLQRPAHVSDEQLHRISKRLNELLCDCDLTEVQRRLQHEMNSDRLQVRKLLEGLKRWSDAPNESQNDLFVSGQRQLFDMPELAVIETVRSLMAAFEEKEQLLKLIEQVEQDDTGVKVFIGSEHALVNMEQVSVVLSRYEGPENIVGTLGVIGPRRMHYERVLPIVDCTARWVSRMLGGNIDS